MHELSIAYSLIELAEEEAGKQNVKVEAVYLKLGALAGVVKEALLFSFEVASQDTRLEGCKLVIEDVPVVIFCSSCQAERMLEPVRALCCPVCLSASGDIRQGKELELAALEVIDRVADAI